jgi:hypothetical protein
MSNPKRYHNNPRSGRYQQSVQVYRSVIDQFQRGVSEDKVTDRAIAATVAAL